MRSQLLSRLGVGILKHYLTYARDGRLDSGTLSGRDPDSDFEVFVADRLRQHGFEVVQVGVAGYFIDLAVRDPQRPDYYLLGIECDGATYHSAKSARDRDRLRQEILEQMRWNIYRIWSTDWFSDPDREMEKLIQHIKGLM
jgi:very-short-patch-repair endonuclease